MLESYYYFFFFFLTIFKNLNGLRSKSASSNICNILQKYSKKKQSSKLAFPIFRCILNLNKINFKTWASNKYTGTVMVIKQC